MIWLLRATAELKSHYAVARWLGLVASFSGALPGMIFPGMGVWIWIFLQGILYTTASEIWFYQNVIRSPPDVVSGYTKVSRKENLRKKRDDSEPPQFSSLS